MDAHRSDFCLSLQKQHGVTSKQQHSLFLLSVYVSKRFQSLSVRSLGCSLGFWFFVCFLRNLLPLELQLYSSPTDSYCASLCPIYSLHLTAFLMLCSLWLSSGFENEEEMSLCVCLGTIFSAVIWKFWASPLLLISIMKIIQATSSLTKYLLWCEVAKFLIPFVHKRVLAEQR